MSTNKHTKGLNMDNKAEVFYNQLARKMNNSDGKFESDVVSALVAGAGEDEASALLKRFFEENDD